MLISWKAFLKTAQLIYEKIESGVIDVNNEVHSSEKFQY